MENKKLSRRTFITRTPVAIAGLVLLGGGLQSASAVQKKTRKPRPPKTCAKWSDTNGDGCCDNSVKTSKTCPKTKCPGHVDHPQRKEDAPEGTCGQWEASSEKEFCSVSLSENRPCTYSTCPANKNHAND